LKFGTQIALFKVLHYYIDKEQRLLLGYIAED